MSAGDDRHAPDGERHAPGHAPNGDRQAPGHVPDGDRPAPDGDRGPSSSPRGDRLALGAIVLGSAIAFVNLRAPLLLIVGVATAAAGVLLALRGDRPLAAPRALQLGLIITVVVVSLHAALGLYADWQAGQSLSEGAPLSLVQDSLRGLERLRAACRSLALFSSLALLIGALVTRSAAAPSRSGK